ncbi:MAG TPA: hypothetical protein VGQ17_00170 [Gemmatimonadales bacterium]|nr:hypothetical protein [Gemmatimonadales bacterium]
MTISPTTRAARRWAGGVALGLTLGLGACDSILDVHDPDIVPDAGSAAGALALKAGVILRFNQAFDGSGDAPDGFFLLGGLLADEWRSGDTFEQRNTTDFRVVQTTNSFLPTIFRSASRVRSEGQAAIDALRKYQPTPLSNIGQLFALTAFSENQIGEFFCNGIPFSEISGTDIIYGNPVSYDSAFKRAVSHADSALAWLAGPDSARIRQFASVIKGRALLNRNLPALAAAAVAAVATNFQYLSTHSVNSTVNVLWQQGRDLRRYVVADNEGTNGLPFMSSNDPRIPHGPNVNSFDNTLQNVPTQGIWNDKTDPVIVASGIEARLIEAEAALRVPDATTFLAKLNAARATRTDLPGLADPGTDPARVDLLFRERAFWMFSTGHRLGDLRRLIRQYGRNPETVFPTGPWFKGNVYGSDVNFPVPFSENNNPNFTGCLNRAP